MVTIHAWPIFQQFSLAKPEFLPIKSIVEILICWTSHLIDLTRNDINEMKPFISTNFISDTEDITVP